MSPRDTGTGKILEEMVLPALLRGGYEVKRQVFIEARPSGHKHRADAVASKNGQQFLISLKWQQVSGTAEQKVPFEVISLASAVRSGKYAKAYLVLGGAGWSLREYFISGGLQEHLRDINLINIVSLETFVALANQGAL